MTLTCCNFICSSFKPTHKLFRAFHQTWPEPSGRRGRVGVLSVTMMQWSLILVSRNRRLWDAVYSLASCYQVMHMCNSYSFWKTALFYHSKTERDTKQTHSHTGPRCSSVLLLMDNFVDGSQAVNLSEIQTVYVQRRSRFALDKVHVSGGEGRADQRHALLCTTTFVWLLLVNAYYVGFIEKDFWSIHQQTL